MNLIKYLLTLIISFTLLSCSDEKDDTSNLSENKKVELVAKEKAKTKQKVVAKKKYKGTLKNIKENGVLRVITPATSDAALPRNGKLLTYERDLALKFSNKLGVELEIREISNYSDIIKAIKNGEGDIAMASLTITDKRKNEILFAKPIDYIYEVVVGAKNNTSKSLKDIDTISVRTNSSYCETLNSNKMSDSTLSFTIKKQDETVHTYEIVEKVANRKIKYTLCDSDIAETVIGYRDEIKVLFKIGKEKPRSWAVNKDSKELVDKLNLFITSQALSSSKNRIDKGDLKSIKKRNVLRVAIRNNASTYWIYKGKEVGFEYNLTRAFAKKLGVRLEMVVVPNRTALLDWVINGKADIAAANITITEKRKERVHFGEPYLKPKEVIVCGVDSIGEPIIKKVEELFNYPIYVRENSSYIETLKALENRFNKKLDIKLLSDNIETEAIIAKVINGEIKVTIADDYIAKIEVSYSKKVAIGPAVSEEREIGWAVRKNSKNLKKEIDNFFTQNPYKIKGLKYNMLYTRYFENSKTISLSKSDDRSDLKGVISAYDTIMKKEAKKSSFSWHAIAAQTYQESKFNPNAKSWAGAIGLMQLMPKTAEELGVKNRLDPKESIVGGTKYMEKMLNKFDKTIPFKDRYYFALASYNVGYGHVIDARRLAAKKGWNRDVWFGNVEKAMLLLSDKKYSSKARYGYCRGSEPVTYVENIDRLYSHYEDIEK